MIALITVILSNSDTVYVRNMWFGMHARGFIVLYYQKSSMSRGTRFPFLQASITSPAFLLICEQVALFPCVRKVEGKKHLNGNIISNNNMNNKHIATLVLLSSI